MVLKNLNAMWQIESQLLVAIQYGDLEQCTKLLKSGADCDQVFKLNCQIRPAISIAIERCSYPMVELLIKYGSSINRQDSKGSTPLHISLEMGYDRITELLLYHRANVNALDQYGISPLHLCAKRGRVELARQLIELGADIKRKDSTGTSPLGYACSNPQLNTTMITLLLSHGAQANDLDKNGNSLLWNALQNPTYEYSVIADLIRHGAKPDLIINGRMAPIHLVILSSSPAKWKCLELMLKSDCDVNLQTKDKRQTLLHLSVLSNDLSSTRILLSAGAEPNTLDRLGRSPLAHALSTGMNEMARILVSAGARIYSVDQKYSFLSTNESDTNYIKSRLNNPMTLTEIGRKGVCIMFGSHTSNWLTKYDDQIPSTLLPFMKFESLE